MDTVLYLYKNECTFGSDIACNNDPDDLSSLSAELHATNLGPGAYYLVVDGFDNLVRGTYTLDVHGTIAVNELCDPALPFLACDRSFCDNSQAPARCLPPKDCVDGFDNDFDQTIDEDTCDAPPVAICPPDQVIAAGSELHLTADPTSSRRIIGSGWEVTSAPFPDFPITVLSGARTATFTPSLVGEYVLRYSVADDQRQAIACETRVHATAVVPLRVEMIFVSQTLSDFVDVDLHVLDPMADAWFDLDFDCSIDSICTDGLPWGGVQHLGDAVGSPGLEVIELTAPLRNGQFYDVGAYYYESDGGHMTDVYARIYCDGSLQREFGPKVLTRGDSANIDNSDFWKIARVTMNAGMGCTIAARDTVVTRLQAEMNR